MRYIITLLALMSLSACLSLSADLQKPFSEIETGMSEDQVRTLLSRNDVRVFTEINEPNCIDHRQVTARQSIRGQTCGVMNGGRGSGDPKVTTFGELNLPHTSPLVSQQSYVFSKWEAYSSPASATTSVIGNTAYTTVRAGSYSEELRSCHVDVWFVNKLVVKKQIRGNAC